MRTAALLGVCVTAAVVVLGFTMLGRSPAAHAARPALHLVGKGPLTVRGEHFRSGERVRVSTAGRAARAKANGNGVFVVTIRGATRCDAVRVLARGSAGSYAVVKVLPLPACAAARSS
jgi:hypothetical protein